MENEEGSGLEHSQNRDLENGYLNLETSSANAQKFEYSSVSQNRTPRSRPCSLSTLLLLFFFFFFTLDPGPKKVRQS